MNGAACLLQVLTLSCRKPPCKSEPLFWGPSPALCQTAPVPSHCVCAGECGKRGGYMEVIGLPKEVRAELTKACSINLCPAVQGQICMALVMKPPKVRPSATASAV